MLGHPMAEWLRAANRKRRASPRTRQPRDGGLEREALVVDQTDELVCLAERLGERYRVGAACSCATTVPASGAQVRLDAKASIG